MKAKVKTPLMLFGSLIMLWLVRISHICYLDVLEELKISFITGMITFIVLSVWLRSSTLSTSSHFLLKASCLQAGHGHHLTPKFNADMGKSISSTYLLMSQADKLCSAMMVFILASHSRDI